MSEITQGRGRGGSGKEMRGRIERGGGGGGVRKKAAQSHFLLPLFFDRRLAVAPASLPFLVSFFGSRRSL